MSVLSLELKLKLKACHRHKESSSVAQYKKQHQALNFNLKMRVIIRLVALAVIQAGKLKSNGEIGPWNTGISAFS